MDLSVKEFSLQIFNQLKLARIETAKLEADLFICEYFSWERHEVILKESMKINELSYKTILNWVQRRSLGEPFAYIVGYKDFYKYRFFVNNNVLIPRPETELLVEYAVNWAKSKGRLNLLDIGCGSGCLGLSVLNELKGSDLTLVDISEEALKVSLLNAEKLGLESSCHFLCKDFNHVDGFNVQKKYDLILSNPPYIDPVNGFVEKNVKKYEPNLALFAEEKGLKEIKNWLILCESFLKKEGLLLMEFGDEQSADIQKFLESRNFYHEVKIHKDYSHHPRFLSAIGVR